MESHPYKKHRGVGVLPSELTSGAKLSHSQAQAADARFSQHTETGMLFGFWYPAMLSRDLRAGAICGATLLEQRAAKRAFATYGYSTREERAKILRRLHEAAAARINDLMAAMVEEYGGIVKFAGPIVQSGIGAFAAAEKALQEMPWTRSWEKTTVTLEPIGVAGLITAWNANALFICLKLASAIAAGCTVVIKPSELSALQTRVLVEALHEADLPQGVLTS
jgi:acyl-CoA reductase-like NAD-dependent aldehyde dehydrogenase